MSSAYTHGHAESVLRSHRARTAANSAAYLQPHLQPGQRLLDVGAGPGTITADLARLVAPGRVTALETSDAVVALTREGVEASGVENVDYLAGDVHALDLPDDSFDVVHAHQVLQHLPDPVQALREMVRVCRPGGVVAVRDADYSAFTWYPPSPALGRWLDLYLQLARANGGEPDAGRRLLAWAREAGCSNVTATASVWCYADDESRTAWGLGWADRILTSAVADQVLRRSLATADELHGISDAWRAWAADPDGWFTLLHGELIIHV